MDTLVRYLYMLAYQTVGDFLQGAMGLHLGERIVLFEVVQTRLARTDGTGPTLIDIAGATNCQEEALYAWATNLVDDGWLVVRDSGYDVGDWDRLIKVYFQAMCLFAEQISKVREIAPSLENTAYKPLSHRLTVGEIKGEFKLVVIDIYRRGGSLLSLEVVLDPLERIFMLMITLQRLKSDFRRGPSPKDFLPLTSLSLDQIGVVTRELIAKKFIVETREGFDLANWSRTNSQIDGSIREVLMLLGPYLDVIDNDTFAQWSASVEGVEP